MASVMERSITEPSPVARRCSSAETTARHANLPASWSEKTPLPIRTGSSDSFPINAFRPPAASVAGPSAGYPDHGPGVP